MINLWIKIKESFFCGIKYLASELERSDQIYRSIAAQKDAAYIKYMTNGSFYK